MKICKTGVILVGLAYDHNTLKQVTAIKSIYCFLGAHGVLPEEDSEGASESKSCLERNYLELAFKF